MKKHKHAEMIKAKADNFWLVVLAKSVRWHEVESDDYQFFNQHESYFLCLPQHKDAVLNVLNGGESQVNYGEGWLSGINCGAPVRWGKSWWYMSEDCESRIKPRKEKRWIAVTGNLEIEDGTLYESYADAYENSPGYKQIVEIEVEV